MTRRYPERTAVMAGSFNPFTLGHLSILRRGLRLFDRVIIFIGRNAAKPAEETDARVATLRELLAPLGAFVEVQACSGLVAQEARKAGAVALLRGVRSVADYEYERNMADVNRMISGIETVLLTAEPELSAVSSSTVRELASYGMDVSQFVPDEHTILQTLKQLTE